MDQPKSAAPPDSASITLSPDMRPAIRAERQEPAPALGRWPMLVGGLGLAMGLTAAALAAWTYTEGQREILRLSTELAQVRVSLDLYARNASQTEGLAALSERLARLEQGALSSQVPMPAAAAVSPAPPGTASGNEDCLPVGMRLLVAAGDSYPICEQAAEVSVSFVDNGYITLSDGTSVASGGTMPLPANPACTIAVTSGGDEGLTGYAEIRVSC